MKTAEQKVSKDSTNKRIFYTSKLSSITDKTKRLKYHFILLHHMESVMYTDYESAYKQIYVQLDDGNYYLMNFSLLYLNCVLWLFNTTFNEPITKKDLYDLSDSTKSAFLSMMDKVLSKFLNLGYSLDDINIGVMKEKIIQISVFYGEIFSNTVSLFDLMAFESRCPEFSRIFNTTLNENMNPNEIEKYLSETTGRFYDLIIEDKKNNLYPFISTQMAKRLQVEQMFVGVGTRQDIDKTILPVIIKQCWVHGLKSISEFYVEAVTTRSSIIVKKEAVPDSGYLSRKVNIACLNTTIDSTIFDCGTKHYLTFLIKDYNHLKLLEGKYMLINEDGPILRGITLNDTHLIGQIVKIRSHTKCITGHKVGKVCCVCLGNKHKTLKNARIGGLVGIKLINPITQLGMSAKHASTTKSEEVGGEIINQFFTVMRSEIYPKKGVKGKLLIKLEIANDLRNSESNSFDGLNFESGSDYSKNIDLILIAEENGSLKGVDIEDRSFFINLSKELSKIISTQNLDIVRVDDIINSGIQIDSQNETDWESELLGCEFVSIELSDLDITEPIFNTKIMTEEVSKYLKDTKTIIDGSKTATYTCPEDIIMDFVDILYRANLKTAGMMIHIETLIMNLMRSVENSSVERLDFSNSLEPNIKFIKLTQAIQKSDLFSMLAFQDLGRQLILPETLKKNRPGIYDCFFKNSEFSKNYISFKTKRPYLFDKNN